MAEKYAGWSPYHYAANNPMRIYDPDGRGWGDVALGAWNSLVTDNTPAQRQNPEYYEDTPEEKRDFAIGQLIGDVVSSVQGGIEFLGGYGATGAGATAEVASAGLATPVAVPVAGAGLVVAAHGSFVLGKSAVGALGSLNYLTQANSSTGNSSTGQSASTSTEKSSKVEPSKTVESIGDKYTKTIEVKPGRWPGQSRAEYVRYKNSRGQTIRTHKDTYDRANRFQHRKPLRGCPEGRPKSDETQ